MASAKTATVQMGHVMSAHPASPRTAMPCARRRATATVRAVIARKATGPVVIAQTASRAVKAKAVMVATTPAAASRAAVTVAAAARAGANLG